MCAGTRNGSSITIAVSSSCRAWVEDIAVMPSRANRAKATGSTPPGTLLGWAHQTPAQRDRRQAMPAAMYRQAVQEAVGGRVVRLARRAHQAGHRREQHE